MLQVQTVKAIWSVTMHLHQEMCLKLHDWEGIYNHTNYDS